MFILSSLLFFICWKNIWMERIFCSWTYSKYKFIHSFILSFIYVFIYLFINLFMYLSIYSPWSNQEHIVRTICSWSNLGNWVHCGPSKVTAFCQTQAYFSCWIYSKTNLSKLISWSFAADPTGGQFKGVPLYYCGYIGGSTTPIYNQNIDLLGKSCHFSLFLPTSQFTHIYMISTEHPWTFRSREISSLGQQTLLRNKPFLLKHN